MGDPLTALRLARRSLAYHARSYALAAAAAATAAAIVTGALLVGDSVRGSLAARVGEKLGRVEHALTGAGFFRQELALDLRRGLEGATDIVPAVSLRCAVTHAGTRSRAGDVHLWGVPDSFWGLEGPEVTFDGPGKAWTGRKAVLNARLGAAIGASAGDAVILHLQGGSEVPAEHALGRRTGTLRTLRLDVERVLPDEGLAIFGLEISQDSPRNVFVPLETLERALEKPGLANALLIASGPPAEDPAATGVGLERLDEALRKAWRLADVGLKLIPRPERGYVALESRELVLGGPVAVAARAAAREARAETEEVFTYLANTLAVGDRQLPYSTITAVKALDGAPIPAGGIVLNDWAAKALGAASGDTVRVVYYALGSDQSLVEKEAVFTLVKVVPLEGAAADPGWTPDYPGISDARTLRDWDPPFPMDLKRIRDADEEYWRHYRTTPKAFVALSDGRRLWESRFGDLTAIRLRPRTATTPGGSATGAAAAIEDLTRELQAAMLAWLDPKHVGFSFRAPRAEGLAAARDGTDFGGLFAGFSSFIIVSALVLLSMVFRLACARRARELGILAAVGFPRGRLRNVLLLDGVVVIACGSLLGALGGLLYAGALIAALRTWWRDAVNASFLALHATWTSLAAGALLSAALALLVIVLVARKAAALPPRALLAGGWGLEGSPGPRQSGGRASLAAAAGGGILAAVLIALGSGGAGIAPEAAFFGGGAAMLAGGLAFASFLLRRSPRLRARAGGWIGLLLVGIGNAGRAPGRSLLTITTIASASFIIVAVASSQRDPGAREPRRDSGDGGFALVGRAAIPLVSSLATVEGRDALNITKETGALLDQARFFALRLRAGDDSSCLNLYRPRSPRILGAPASFLERGGFAWSESLAASPPEKENPWLLLDRDLGDAVVPAVGDANAVRWILQSGLGKDIGIADERGRSASLRIVGLLSHSIFQGELIVSEQRFVKLFPGTSGHPRFLFEVKPDDVEALARGLEADLEEHGFDAERTAEVLAAYQAVENTYLSTFQVLGGLGLLLGTVGLAAVILRGVQERQGEIAILRAVGFTGGAIAGLVLVETAFLLAAGLLIGAVSALLAVLPNAASAEGAVSWVQLAGTFAAVFLTGLAASTLAVRAALRAKLVPALRRD